MEQNKSNKFRLKLNLFDGIVIAAALLVGGFLLLSRMQPADTAATPAAEKIRYTICFQKTVVGTGDAIEVGDDLVDNVKNFALGKVAEVRTEQAVSTIVDQTAGKYVQAVIPNAEDVYITVESTATSSEDSILVGGGHALRVGEQIFVKGPGFLGSGIVYQIERGE